MTSRAERWGLRAAALFCATYGPWSVWGDQLTTVAPSPVVGLAGGVLAGVVAGVTTGVAQARARRRRERKAHPLHEPRPHYDGPAALLPDAYPPAMPAQLARSVGVVMLAEQRRDPVTLERAAAVGLGGAMHSGNGNVSHSVGMLPDCQGCGQLIANAKRNLIATRSALGGRV